MIEPEPELESTVEAAIEAAVAPAAASAVESVDHDARAFLAQVPLFATVSEQARAELAAAATWVRVSSDEYLFREGEVADSLAIVWSGRMHIVDESDFDLVDESHDAGPGGDRDGGEAGAPVDRRRPGRVVGVLGRDDWVGELAVLSETPRATAVRALRESEVLLVPADVFRRVLDREPQLGATLARRLATQLQWKPRIAVSRTEPDTVCVIPLSGGLPVDRLVARLTRTFATYGPVAVMTEDGAVVQSDGPNLAPLPLPPSMVPARSPIEDDRADVVAARHRAWVARLEALELDHAWVVLVAPDPDEHPRWASFAVRSADRVLAMARGGRPPAWAPDLLGRDTLDVVFVGGNPTAGPTFAGSRMTPTLDALTPRAHHHLPEGAGFDRAADRIGRRTSGHSLGVVFSGGGARGLAHLGVIERLVAAGAPIDRVGGCSAGALAAALLAMGHSPEEMIAICREELVEHRPFTDFTVPREGLIRGKRVRAMLERVFGDARIEELTLPMFAVSADLETGELVVHRTGLLRDALAASMSIPGLAPPIRLDGQLLVDGGLLNNLPVDVMQEAGEGPVLAVDVGRGFPVPPDPGGDAPAESRRPDALRETAGPGIISTIARSMVLGGWQRSEQNRRSADLLISPAVHGIGMFDFDRIDDAVEAGRRAADEAIARGLPTAAR